MFWKNEDRLLFRTQIRADEGRRSISYRTLGRLGDRLLAINRDGTQLAGMLNDSRSSALAGAFNLGEIGSFLPKNPEHVLMYISGWNGRSLFKVNVLTGVGTVVERPLERVWGWWLDVEGAPLVRVEVFAGTISLSRKQSNSKWKRFYKVRMRDLENAPTDCDPIGPSDQEGKFYVLASPPGKNRKGLYLYDLEKEEFGDVVVEHPQYDLDSARISRDGTRIIRHCHIAHVRVCECKDPKLNAHMKGIRKYFSEAATVYIQDVS